MASLAHHHLPQAALDSRELLLQRLVDFVAQLRQIGRDLSEDQTGNQPLLFAHPVACSALLIDEPGLQP